MLGSAIPRRWMFSLALVGLVTIFAVSYSAVWSSPANADSQGVGGGSGNSVAKTPAQTLDTADALPTGLTLQPGQQLNLTANLQDATGADNNSLTDLTFAWTTTGGLSVVAGGSSPTAIIQATSSGTVKVTVTQVQESQTWVVIREATISVVAPVATSTPVPPPSNPSAPPSSIPNSQAVISPEGSTLVSTTGVESGSSPEGQSVKDRPVVYVRSGSVLDHFGINVTSVDPGSLPTLPSNFNLGSSAVDISFMDATGAAQSNFRTLKSLRFCLPTQSSDRVNGFSNVKVLRENAAVGQYVELVTTYNTLTQQACASSSNFSNFVVGIQQIQATPSSGGGLPATGGWSPSVGLLLFAGILGFVFIGGGAISMRRARSARPE